VEKGGEGEWRGGGGGGAAAAAGLLPVRALLSPPPLTWKASAVKEARLSKARGSMPRPICMREGGREGVMRREGGREGAREGLLGECRTSLTSSSSSFAGAAVAIAGWQ